jgi:hypothetical protein
LRMRTWRRLWPGQLAACCAAGRRNTHRVCRMIRGIANHGGAGLRRCLPGQGPVHRGCAIGKRRTIGDISQQYVDPSCYCLEARCMEPHGDPHAATCCRGAGGFQDPHTARQPAVTTVQVASTCSTYGQLHIVKHGGCTGLKRGLCITAGNMPPCTSRTRDMEFA